MTPEEINQIEQFIRIGCIAAQHDKSVEDRQQIGATALHLIQRLKESQAPKPEAAET